MLVSIERRAIGEGVGALTMADQTHRDCLPDSGPRRVSESSSSLRKPVALRNGESVSLLDERVVVSRAAECNP